MITDRTSARDVTADDVRELINQRRIEESALEYKEAPDTDLLKAACGIANFGGGFILVGVQEDAKHQASGIKAVTKSQSVADSIRQTLRDGISPRPVVEVVVLPVDGSDVIIVRVAPQNPPHMMSKDKRTDFYGRYDATTERMRYEEIEQFFRDKHGAGELFSSATPKAIIDSTLGRTEVSEGAKGFLDQTIAKIVASGDATFALVVASDGNDGSIAENDAVRFFKEPLYRRRGGWVIAHPELDVDFRSGVWEQRYGTYSLTTVTPSGDLIFKKPVDEVLCWKQPEDEFLVGPRLYPNAVVEYCLSFAYMLADIIASSRPTRLLIVPAIIAGDEQLRLPRGEGGSIWFNAQVSEAQALIDSNSVGRTIPEAVTLGRPILPRNIAFRIASQVYSFFGYNPRQVAFASADEVTVEPDADTATLISLRTYLRDTLLAEVSPPHEDFGRGCFMFAIELADGRHVFWVSEEFVNDHHLQEVSLFALLDSLKLADAIHASNKTDKLLLSNDGIVPLPPSR